MRTFSIEQGAIANHLFTQFSSRLAGLATSGCHSVSRPALCRPHNVGPLISGSAVKHQPGLSPILPSSNGCLRDTSWWFAV
jgi:hypothetical protein